MSAKPATPGTGLTAPLYLLDKRGEVVNVIGSNTQIVPYTVTTVDDTSLATIKATVETNLNDIKDFLDALVGQA